MRNFDYRAPRFPVDLPVQVEVENVAQTGRCTEIGFGGMRLVSLAPLAADVNAVIQICYRSMFLKIPARVVHQDADGNGMQFLWESDKQKEGVARLIDLLSGSTEYSSPCDTVRSRLYEDGDSPRLWTV